jgi:hypothetical protein
MPQKPPQAVVTVADLASPPRGEIDRFVLFERYGKQKPTADAIPLLRRALADSFHGTVKCAAHSLRKLGPAARGAMDDLLAAAARVDASTGMPQAYPECVAAMAAIDPRHPELLPLIKSFVGLDNWVPISASLKALKAIGTTEANDLLHRTAAFWLPELNTMQRRVVEQLLAENNGGDKGTRRR